MHLERESKGVENPSLEQEREKWVTQYGNDELAYLAEKFGPTGSQEELFFHTEAHSLSFLRRANLLAKELLKRQPQALTSEERALLPAIAVNHDAVIIADKIPATGLLQRRRGFNPDDPTNPGNEGASALKLENDLEQAKTEVGEPLFSPPSIKLGIKAVGDTLPAPQFPVEVEERFIPDAIQKKWAELCKQYEKDDDFKTIFPSDRKIKGLYMGQLHLDKALTSREAVHPVRIIAGIADLGEWGMFDKNDPEAAFRMGLNEGVELNWKLREDMPRLTFEPAAQEERKVAARKMLGWATSQLAFGLLQKQRYETVIKPALTDLGDAEKNTTHPEVYAALRDTLETVANSFDNSLTVVIEKISQLFENYADVAKNGDMTRFKNLAQEMGYRVDTETQKRAA